MSSDSNSLKTPSITSSTALASNKGILKRIFSSKPSRSRSTSSLNTAHTKSSGRSDEDQGYETINQSDSFFRRIFRHNSRSSIVSNYPLFATSPLSSFYCDQSSNCEQLLANAEVLIDHVFPENGQLDALPDKAINLILEHLWHKDRLSILNCRLASKSTKSRIDRFISTVLQYPNRVLSLATISNVDNGDVVFWRAHSKRVVNIASVADLIRLSNIKTSIVDVYLDGSEFHNIALLTTFIFSKFPFDGTNIRVFTKSLDFITSLPFSRLLSTNANWSFWLMDFQAPIYATDKSMHTFEFEKTTILVNFFGDKKYAKTLRFIKESLTNQSKSTAITACH